MKTLHSLQRFILIATTLFMAFEPFAEAHTRRKKSIRCPEDVATSTMYNLPKLGDFCKGGEICRSFRRAVGMQGSGLLPGNRILRYNGKIEKNDACPTARGATGECLTPFLSIAADPRYFRMGDILSMPGLKGQKVRLPDGRIMTHPGFVAVQDVGGAIKGPNRFDFFVGTHKLQDSKNLFGIGGRLSMSDKKDCSADYKKFTVIRAPANRREPSEIYSKALASIEKSYSNAGNFTNIRLASIANPSGFNGTTDEEGVH